VTDYIIVGAGSAGCILANRLSADPTAHVTLLEAGPPANGVLYRIPAGFFGLMKAGIGNWHYECVPQAGLNGRTMYFPRGKVLGGSSSINGQVLLRGNQGDYDGWAQSGATGWSFEQCLPYFRKLERHPDGDTHYHGGSGLIGVTVPPPVNELSPVAQAWFKAVEQAGYPYSEDLNGVSQEGIGRPDANFADGVRQSTASTYLAEALSRPNLTVITGAQATRVIVKGRRATGIEYARKGRRHTLETSGEVILAGGTVNSPQLLQLSGIGAPGLLQKHGIPVVHELPGVGENLQDHACVVIKQEMTQPLSALPYTQPVRATMALIQYALFKTGPTLSNGLEAMAFFKTRPELEYPDVQYHLLNLLYEDHGRKVIQRHGFMASANISRPHSRGSVRIASGDPLAAPLIDPNYFAEEEDMRTARAALRLARELIAMPAFDAFRGSEYAPGAAVQSDAELDQFIRNSALSIYHPVGTCRMGTDPMAVVDPELRVHGIDHLRVVDASVMPTIVSANTNAAAMMIGERAADFIIGRQGARTAMAA
jgi:choline dehydrogenase